jgi:uncharacterized membrane protein YfcA/uncharacterized membrane protein YedE/YeeE
MTLVIALSTLVGIALGMLGGGGSILTIPILTYAAGLPPKEAMATSLFVVFVTSLSALVPHAFRRLVSFRNGAAFGLSGMLGAYLGGRASAWVPGELLMTGFGLTMLATSLAMLRRPEPQATGARPPRESSTALLAMALRGLAVGSVTGLFGAGGGFLIVPAFVLLCGMPMRRAVATSLLVISMQSFAGFLGHVSHVAINWPLALSVTAAAVFGSFVGGLLAGRVPGRLLRTAFGTIVAVTALIVLARELSALLPQGAYRALFVVRWPWWISGAAIAAVVLLLALFENKQLGVSTGCSELCAMPSDESARRSWRPPFLLGIAIGGALAGLLAGRSPTLAMGSVDTLVGNHVVLELALLLGAGVLIGRGARLAGGCTSGHSIVGTALGARSSWIATLAFMGAGFVTTQLVRLIGGT